MESPFAEYKATELTSERLSGYFVEPRYINKMYTNNVSFVIGQRGSGKTTLLKHLCSSYNKNDGLPKQRLGIYYRFDINKMHSFSGAVLSDEEWDVLFAHCFSIEICLLLTKLLIDLKENYPLDDEMKICKKIRHLFFEEYDKEITSLEELSEYLEHVDYIAKRYKRNPLRVPTPMISECEKTFEEYCSLISQQSSYKNICIHFLFDEYENMLDYQKRFINSCAKNASYYHTYKICVRPYGADEMKTRKVSEVLNEADDFKTLDYINDIIGNANDVADFMKKACAKRLEKYYTERKTPFSEIDLNIEYYFPNKKSDEELFAKLSKNKKYIKDTQKEVVSIFNSFGKEFNENWDLLQMKLFIALYNKRDFNIDSIIEAFNTKNSTYKNWINNYKKAILFLCFSEQKMTYEMSGFEDIISIAGNVVRYVLEICDYCFLCTGHTNDGKYSNISEKMQTDATCKVSQRRFQQISTIPDYGQEIKQMVLVIGHIFNMYHRDTQIQRFEPNHFVIKRRNATGRNYMDSKMKKAIQFSVMYGVFEAERSTKKCTAKDVPIEDEEFHLHPILTPYFQISWRKKQKCSFTLDEINDFLFGSDECVSKHLSYYYGKTKTYNEQQITFEQMKKECY